MNITRGKIQSAQKVVVYGPEGIGKSTFASKFPDPLFIDTEGSTKNLDIARMDKPSSWTMLKNEIAYVKANPDVCKTLVIDTIDWAEQLCINDICAMHDKSGIEDFGYGNGYVYEKEEFGRFLNSLEDLIEIGINVVLTAHAQLRKFSQPDEIGEYDRWELKLGKKTGSQISPLVKEWADILLFANYKTIAVATDKEGKKFKAQGGGRIMYTEHHPCWDAKNRNDLGNPLPFDYEQIAHIFNGSKPETKPQPKATAPQTPTAPPTADSIIDPLTTVSDKRNTGPGEQATQTVTVSDKLPKALADLMITNNVTEDEIRLAVSQRGYFPLDTPIENYPSDFVKGVLIGAWQQVYDMVLNNRDLPFD